MKKRILLTLLTLLSFVAIAEGQTTTVTLNVTDSASVVWAGATYTATINQPAGRPPGPFFLNGVALTPSQTTVTGTLSGSGSASFSLTSNTSITPALTTWGFQVCFTVGNPCYFSAPFTITGGTQTVNLTPPPVQSGGVGSSSSGAVGSATNSAGPVMGLYLTNSCPSSNTGQCYFTSADTQQSNDCNWANGGATVTCFTHVGQVKASLTGNVATYVGAFGTTFPSTWVAGNTLVVTQFTGSDTFFNQTCTLSTVTATTVTCPLTHANFGLTTSSGQVQNQSIGPFVSSDVGKRIFGYGSCAAFYNVSLNTNNSPMTTATAQSIQAFVSSTQITLSGLASVTSNTNGGCAIWGHADDTGAAALDAVLPLSVNCPKVFFAASYYLYTTPHHTANPKACKDNGANLVSPTLGSLSTQAPLGNMLYAAGFELEGRGRGPTTVFVPTGFPETGACTNGNSGKACFVVPTEGRWTDIMLNGGGNFSAANIPDQTILVEVDGPASLDNFTCINWSSVNGVNHSYGIGAFYWAQLTNVNSSSCGSYQVATNPNADVTAIRLSIDNPFVWGIALGLLTDYAGQQQTFDSYNFTCISCLVFSGAGTSAAGNALIENHGSKIKLFRSTLTSFASAVNGNIGYDCATTANCVLDAEDTDIDLTQSGTVANTNQIAINCVVNCTNYLKGVTFKGSSTGGFSLKDTAGSITYDLGGNTAGTNLSISGKVVGSTSIKGTSVVAGNLVPSANFGTGAAVSAVTGNSTDFTFTLTNGSAAVGANPTIAFTFPLAFWQTPVRCSLWQVGGTQAITATTTTMAPSALSATGVTFTYNGTPTINLTEFYQGSCTN